MEESRTLLFGVPSSTMFLILGVILVAWLLSRRIETFSGKGILTENDYIQDVRNVAGYVGPYIGEIYLHLRAKYFSSPSMKTGPMFVPGGINDPTLADPLLPIARTQIKSWIDSNHLRFNKKYSKDFLNLVKPKWDLTYKEANNGVLEVTYTANGQSSTYVV